MSADTAPPTGAELAREIQVAARAAGVSVTRFLKPLGGSTSLMTSLRDAQRPLPRTILRVRALIAGSVIPQAPYKTATSALRYKNRVLHESFQGHRIDASHAIIAIDREPCTYCAVRADIGCKHQRAST